MPWRRARVPNTRQRRKSANKSAINVNRLDPTWPTQEELQARFAVYGTVKDVALTHKVFAFVTFKEAKAAAEAIWEGDTSGCVCEEKKTKKRQSSKKGKKTKEDPKQEMQRRKVMARARRRRTRTRTRARRRIRKREEEYSRTKRCDG